MRLCVNGVRHRERVYIETVNVRGRAHAHAQVMIERLRVRVSYPCSAASPARARTHPRHRTPCSSDACDREGRRSHRRTGDTSRDVGHVRSKSRRRIPLPCRRSFCGRERKLTSLGDLGGGEMWWVPVRFRRGAQVWAVRVAAARGPGLGSASGGGVATRVGADEFRFGDRPNPSPTQRKRRNTGSSPMTSPPSHRRTLCTGCARGRGRRATCRRSLYTASGAGCARRTRRRHSPPCSN